MCGDHSSLPSPLPTAASQSQPTELPSGSPVSTTDVPEPFPLSPVANNRQRLIQAKHKRPSAIMSVHQPSPRTPAQSDSQGPGRQSKRLKHTEVEDLSAPVVLHPDIAEEEGADSTVLKGLGLVQEGEGEWYHPGSVFRCTARPGTFCLWHQDDIRRCSVTTEINGYTAEGAPARVLEPLGSLYVPACLNGASCRWSGISLTHHILRPQDGDLIVRRLTKSELGALDKRAKYRWFGDFEDFYPRIILTKPPTPVATPTVAPKNTYGKSQKSKTRVPPTPNGPTLSTQKPPPPPPRSFIKLRLSNSAATSRRPEQGMQRDVDGDDDDDQSDDSVVDVAVVLEGHLIVTKTHYQALEQQLSEVQTILAKTQRRRNIWKEKAEESLAIVTKAREDVLAAEEKLKKEEEKYKKAEEVNEALRAMRLKYLNAQNMLGHSEKTVRALQKEVGNLGDVEAKYKASEATIKVLLQVGERGVDARNQLEEAQKKIKTLEESNSRSVATSIELELEQAQNKTLADKFQAAQERLDTVIKENEVLRVNNERLSSFEGEVAAADAQIRILQACRERGVLAEEELEEAQQEIKTLKREREEIAKRFGEMQSFFGGKTTGSV